MNLYVYVYPLTRAMVAKFQNWVAKANSDVFSHNSGGQKSKVKVLGNLCSSQKALGGESGP